MIPIIVRAVIPAPITRRLGRRRVRSDLRAAPIPYPSIDDLDPLLAALVVHVGSAPLRGEILL
jgi:hypothetical protein